MKKFKWLGLLLVIYAGSVFSQTIPGSVWLYPSETSNIEKEIAPPNTSYKYGGYAVGMEITGTVTHIYRSHFKFDLSTIPVTAHFI